MYQSHCPLRYILYNVSIYHLLQNFNLKEKYRQLLGISTLKYFDVSLYHQLTTVNKLVGVYQLLHIWWEICNFYSNSFCWRQRLYPGWQAVWRWQFFHNFCSGCRAGHSRQRSRQGGHLFSQEKIAFCILVRCGKFILIPRDHTYSCLSQMP